MTIVRPSLMLTALLDSSELNLTSIKTFKTLILEKIIKNEKDDQF